MVACGVNPGPPGHAAVPGRFPAWGGAGSVGWCWAGENGYRLESGLFAAGGAADCGVVSGACQDGGRWRWRRMTDVGATPMAEPNARTRAVARVMGTRLGRSMQGEGLRAKVMRGTGWTVLGFGASQFLRLASTLLLTRLLFPEAFGLLALASVFLTGLQLFSDIGIRPAIIQSARGADPSFLNTAWTLQIIRGAAIWIISCILAKPVSAIYEQPLLFPILCALGATAAIQGFNSIGFATSHRSIQLGRITIVELCVQMISISFTVGFAMIYRSPWALVAGSLAGALSQVTLGHFFLRGHSHHLQWERSAASQIVTFGKWILATSALTFVTNQGDRVILGKLFSITELGVYVIALTLIETAFGLLNKISTTVGFASFSHIARSNFNNLKDRFYRFRQIIELSSIAVSSFLFVFGPSAINLMYDERYSEAGWMVQLLAMRVAVGSVASTNIRLLWSIGKSRHDTEIQIIRTALLFISVPTGFHIAAAPGAVAAVLLNHTIGYPISLLYMAKYQMLDRRCELRFLMLGTLASLLSLGLFSLLSR